MRRWNTTTLIVFLLIRWSGGEPRGSRSGFKVPLLRADPSRRHYQVGSLAGAAHLSNDNAGVLRWAQWEQKSHVEQKGKSWLDFDFQYEYKPGNRGLSILSVFRIWSERCQKSYHRWASSRCWLLSLWHILHITMFLGWKWILYLLALVLT